MKIPKINFYFRREITNELMNQFQTFIDQGVTTALDAIIGRNLIISGFDVSLKDSGDVDISAGAGVTAGGEWISIDAPTNLSMAHIDRPQQGQTKIIFLEGIKTTKEVGSASDGFGKAQWLNEEKTFNLRLSESRDTNSLLIASIYLTQSAKFSELFVQKNLASVKLKNNVLSDKVEAFSLSATYKKGERVTENFMEFFCMKNGVKGISPFTDAVENGHAENWRIWMPGRGYGDSAFFYFKVPPLGWFYTKDYAYNDVEKIANPDLKARIKALHKIPACKQWFDFFEDHDKGTTFFSLLSKAADMGTLRTEILKDSPEAGALQGDAMQDHFHDFFQTNSGVSNGAVPLTTLNLGSANANVPMALGAKPVHVTYANVADETRPKNIRGYRAIYVGGEV